MRGRSPRSKLPGGHASATRLAGRRHTRLTGGNRRRIELWHGIRLWRPIRQRWQGRVPRPEAREPPEASAPSPPPEHTALPVAGSTPAGTGNTPEGTDRRTAPEPAPTRTPEAQPTSGASAPRPRSPQIPPQSEPPGPPSPAGTRIDVARSRVFSSPRCRVLASGSSHHLRCDTSRNRSHRCSRETIHHIRSEQARIEKNLVSHIDFRTTAEMRILTFSPKNARKSARGPLCCRLQTMGRPQNLNRLQGHPFLSSGFAVEARLTDTDSRIRFPECMMRPLGRLSLVLSLLSIAFLTACGTSVSRAEDKGDRNQDRDHPRAERRGDHDRRGPRDRGGDREHARPRPRRPRPPRRRRPPRARGRPPRRRSPVSRGEGPRTRRAPRPRPGQGPLRGPKARNTKSCTEHGKACDRKHHHGKAKSSTPRGPPTPRRSPTRARRPPRRSPTPRAWRETSRARPGIPQGSR